MKKTPLTETGKIAAHCDCPFRSRCEIASSGGCLQKGIAQGASILTLISNPTSLSLVRELPMMARACRLIDSVIAEFIASGSAPVDGFVELSYVALLDRGASEGLDISDVQFVLNSLDRGTWSFGGRDCNDHWVDQTAVFAILRGFAMKEPEATSAAKTTRPVVRISAFHPVEFSCAVARGFAIAEGWSP